MRHKRTRRILWLRGLVIFRVLRRGMFKSFPFNKAARTAAPLGTSQRTPLAADAKRRLSLNLLSLSHLCTIVCVCAWLCACCVHACHVAYEIAIVLCCARIVCVYVCVVRLAGRGCRAALCVRAPFAARCAIAANYSVCVVCLCVCDEMYP